MKNRTKISIIGFILLLTMLGVIAYQLGQKKCIVGKDSCGNGYVCAKGLHPPFSQGYCIEAHSPLPDVLQLPIHQTQGVICTQSGQNPNGSHGFHNTLFALDLTSPKDVAPAVVLSARSGYVLKVNDTCRDPGTSTNHIDDCGSGFGNYVIVDHEDGFVTFYAHLSKTTVRVGDPVKKDAKIGIEGITGAAGHRHLHFSVHRKSKQPLLGAMSWPSVPFDIEFTVDGKTEKMSIMDIVCRHNDFDQRRWFRKDL